MTNSIVPVNDTDKKEMARLMDIMNGNVGKSNVPKLLESNYVGNQSHNSPIESSYQSYPSAGVGLSDADVKDMKSILERFNRVTNEGVQELVQESKRNPVIREALETRRTASGSQVANWEIRIRVGENDKNFHNVVNVGTQEIIAENIELYEAALALVKALNTGKKINSPEIRQIMNLEETYSVNRFEAIQFKKKAVRLYENGNDRDGRTYENKFENSKALALEAQKKLKSLSKL